MISETEKIKLEEAIRTFAQRHGGRFTAEMIVEEAKNNPHSPFFQYFEWDQEKAAWAHWVDRARELIRSVRVEVTIEDREYRIVEYVRDPEVKRGKQGYVSVKTLYKEPENAEAAIMNEFAMAEAYLDRARGLAAFLHVEKPTIKAQQAVKRAKRAVEKKKVGA